MLPVYVFYGIPLESWGYLRHREVSLRPSRSCVLWTLHALALISPKDQGGVWCSWWNYAWCTMSYLHMQRSFCLYFMLYHPEMLGCCTGRFTEMPHSKLSKKHVRSTKTCCHVYFVLICANCLQLLGKCTMQFKHWTLLRNYCKITWNRVRTLTQSGWFCIPLALSNFLLFIFFTWLFIR